jgi:hypothetical protein
MGTVSLGWALLVSCAAGVAWTAAAAQEFAPSDALSRPAPDAGRETTNDWKFESVTLKDGTSHLGLIQAERRQEIEFVEVVRSAGKPMYAVVRPLDPRSVVSRVRLEEADRNRLVERLQAFRNRARIEAGRMESVTLREEQRDGMPCRVYEGDWFTLESRADEAMTRRSIVRIEQVFRAYRQLLPPRVTPPRSLRVVLFGAMEDYHAFVDQLGLKLETPGFFIPAQNLLVAGSDLNLFSRRLAQVRAENMEVRRQYESLRDSFPRRLESLTKELREKGLETAAIEQEVGARKTSWQREFKAAMSRLDRVEQQNEAKFGDVTRQMFARLYHEAFHAYVENYVYPQRQGALPRWLNEGLAQVFESGQLDADTLRLDAPDRERLKRLQDDLKSDHPLPLLDVLTATEGDFLDAGDGAAAQRRYLYSWGLAYDLAFLRNLLNSQSLSPYVVNQDSYGPAARFTRFSGLPLAKFEAQWRAAMLDLPPRS